MSLKNRFKASFPENRQRSPRGRLLILLMVALGILCYSNTLKSPFVYDDANNILGNPSIRISELSVQNLLKAGFGGPLKTRPLAYISLALNYYFNGFAVEGYHMVNIVIHLLTGVFLYLFLSVILTRCAPQSAATSHHKAVVFFSAAIWLAIVIIAVKHKR